MVMVMVGQWVVVVGGKRGEMLIYDFMLLFVVYCLFVDHSLSVVMAVMPAEARICHTSRASLWSLLGSVGGTKSPSLLLQVMVMVMDVRRDYCSFLALSLLLCYCI